MKKILLALALMLSLPVMSREKADVVGVAGVAFGASYDETMATLKGNFGEPSSKGENQLVYLNKMFEGMKTDRIEMGFQQLNGTTMLNQARFYFYCGNKAAAVAKMKALAKAMQAEYDVSYDEEDGGVAFYKGGCSPSGIGCLFTIYVSPYHGKWTCQLRYGKFLFS